MRGLIVDDDKSMPRSPENRTPVPDPTLLTTQQLVREIAAVRGILEAQIEAETNLTTARFVAVHEKIDHNSGLLREIPELIRSEILHLKNLHDERFVSIETQFKERDVRTESSARDSKIAVDAALQAAKEAVGEQNRSAALAISKSETATVKQIDQQGLLIQTATKSLDDKINDMKDRLTRIEGVGAGRDVGLNVGWIIFLGIIGLVSAIGSVLSVVEHATK
jgi:hypothetical protein